MEERTVAKRRRISKKKLKEPDEFISTAARILLWIGQNWRLILIGIVIGGLVAFSIVFWRIRMKKRDLEALNSFHRASELLSAAEDPSSKDYQEALDEFERVRGEYPHTDAGQLAQLQLGQGFLESKRYDKAVEIYRTFLDGNPGESLYRLIALQNLGYAYEGQGDYQSALDSFQGLVELGESFLQPWGYLSVGRCYEKLGKREEALNIYRIFLEKFPDSTMALMVKHKIGALGESSDQAKTAE
ncbi:MAG: tetratricopeptide repeat protein [Syntrophobacterales bacterium]|nr:MAG: tetratricopeptide repeat protein [Syntrophobacterales bacterium]